MGSMHNDFCVGMHAGYINNYLGWLAFILIKAMYFTEDIISHANNITYQQLLEDLIGQVLKRKKKNGNIFLCNSPILLPCQSLTPT